MARTFVIAEAGSTHDGDFAKALALIEAARDAGCDAVKFQFWSNPDRLADRRRVPDRYREIYRRYQVIPEWLPELAAACSPGMGARPIELMCTSYLPEDVPVIAPFVERFKIASFEADDRAFLDAHHGFGKNLIVSAGMLNQDELEDLDVDLYSDAILLCTSAYPAPPESMQLGVLKREGLYAVKGVSDHSRHPWMGALAVAAGAEIIEAHLRLNDTDPQNPDFATAFSPSEFADYVRHIRFAEACLGDGEKKLQACEHEMARYRVQS